MLFQRYASPTILLDKMIMTGRFFEFVCEFVEIRNSELEDQTRWEYFLHKVFNMTFQEYLAQITMSESSGGIETATPDALTDTVKNSMGIINGFCPS